MRYATHMWELCQLHAVCDSQAFYFGCIWEVKLFFQVLGQKEFLHRRLKAGSAENPAISWDWQCTKGSNKRNSQATILFEQLQEMGSDPFSLELVCQLLWWGNPCILSPQYLMFHDNRPGLSKSFELFRMEVFIGSLEMPAECMLEPNGRTFPLQCC